jgi:polyhydroxybutyrate depolymerase
MLRIGLALFLVPVPTAIAVAQEQLPTYSFIYDGRERSFILKLPEDYQPGIPLPLIISMHGAGGTAEGQRTLSGFDEIADSQSVIVVYPNGVNNVWESGRVPGTDTVDDVGFISALIDVLAANVSVDLTRVYASGFSNGGFMSYRLACELEERIAAIGSVAGTMNQDIYESCNPDRPVPIVHIHGTRDRIVPYNGTVLLPGVIEVLTLWGEINQCSPEFTRDRLPDRDRQDGSTVTQFSSQPCAEETAIELYRVNNGGHTWPGASPTRDFNSTNQDIEASLELTAFFSRFSLPPEQVPTAAPNRLLSGEPLPELRLVTPE